MMACVTSRSVWGLLANVKSTKHSEIVFKWGALVCLYTTNISWMKETPYFTFLVFWDPSFSASCPLAVFLFQVPTPQMLSSQLLHFPLPPHLTFYCVPPWHHANSEPPRRLTSCHTATSAESKRERKIFHAGKTTLRFCWREHLEANICTICLLRGNQITGLSANMENHSGSVTTPWDTVSHSRKFYTNPTFSAPC